MQLVNNIIANAPAVIVIAVFVFAILTIKTSIKSCKKAFIFKWSVLLYSCLVIVVSVIYLIFKAYSILIGWEQDPLHMAYEYINHTAHLVAITTCYLYVKYEACVGLRRPKCFM